MMSEITLQICFKRLIPSFCVFIFAASSDVHAQSSTVNKLRGILVDFVKETSGDALGTAILGEDAPETYRKALGGVGWVAAEKGISVLIEGKDDPVSNALRQLIGHCDEDTSLLELREMLRRMDAKFYPIESRISELQYQQDKLREDSRQNTANIGRNSALIEKLDESIIRTRAQLNAAIERIDVELSSIREDISRIELSINEESRIRAAEDAIHAREIARLSRLVSPDTSRKTASILGAKAATLLINNEDPEEAAKVLQLAIAYDKREHAHPDPGLRYYLAIAYRRMGKEILADELVMEGIVAQRFRDLPEWYRQRTQYFQGPDRQWLRDKQFDPRFGVRAPRIPEVRSKALIPYRVSLPDR